MTITAELATSEDRAAWDAFVESQPDATFFHRFGWKSVIEDSLNHTGLYVIAKQASEIVGVLPLVYVKSRLFGRALISNAFCIAGGPLAVDQEARSALIRRALDLRKETGANYIEFRDSKKQLETGWTRQDDIYANFARHIEPDEQENLKQIPRKQRAVVRKALKVDGLTQEIDESVDRLYKLYALNVRNHGTPVYAKKFFARLAEEFSDDCEVLTVCHRGAPVSSVMSFYFRDVVLPYYTGGTADARKLGANDFMYWSTMRRAIERGQSTFDFGRSKQGTGPFSFKKNWGFEPRPIANDFYLESGSELPNINPTNKKYQLFIAAWQRLPLPIANIIGPHIVRNIG